MGYSQTDKDRVQSLTVKKTSLSVQGVGRSLAKGQTIDRDADTTIFDAIYESGATIADTGSHSNEAFEVNSKRDRTIEPHFYVGPNGDDTNDGTRAKPFKTIDKAVSFLRNDFSATVDKKVEVMAGSFAENITLDVDNVEFVGKGPNNTDMDNLTVNSGVNAEVEDMKVANLTVDNANTTLWLEDVEVGTDFTINDNSNVSVSADSMKVGGTVTDAGGHFSVFSDDLSTY